MELLQLKRYLDDPVTGAEWLRAMGLVDGPRAHGNLLNVAMSGLTLDLLTTVVTQMEGCISTCADPDMALNNLERFFEASRNPLALGTLFERDPEALPTLVQIFSTSQHLSDLLVADPQSFDLLRLTGGQPFARNDVVQDLVSEVDALEDDRMVLQALRRFKRRETLRISYGDIIRDQPLKTVTSQISYLADALVEAALRAARRKVEKKRGPAVGANGEATRFVVLALGKLGGSELNYSSDIDLIFLYDGDEAPTGGRSISHGEYFSQVGRELSRLLTETTELGSIYRVDLRLRPDGDKGPMVVSREAALQYYENRGRTWERQAFIKARPAAGDLDLGSEFLEELAPWIYRRYLSRADITGIRALKRRIEKRADREASQARDVKTGRGGIRDIEFAIQFLQLLNGADLPELRTGNTLEAILHLESAGCLTHPESQVLRESYGFLRKAEHRLQIMFDLQTHRLPETAEGTRKLALRMGYVDSPDRSALDAFEEDYQNYTELNRGILDHLLHDAFSDDAETEAEVDLVLDPDPPEEQIQRVLGKYPFRDIKQAYHNLMSLSVEKIRFLSTRRCRHFLAAIAPSLLERIAVTPDPDSALVNLDRVSDSLGGKGVLWELFSFSTPSLKLYVRLCAYSPYLSGILTSNPGMIDGLMDSLVLDKLPSPKGLRKTLADLCRGAEDTEPILHSFRNDQQLRVGVRDILGKEDILTSTGALSNIAQTCLEQIAGTEYERLTAKYGVPTVPDGRREGKPCEMVILAMGKFGGQEMNYHSDLDIVFLYEAEGRTVHGEYAGRADATSNQHFFSELGQRIIKITSQLGPNGRLYEIDARLRPTGQSGSLATSLEEFSRYFAEGDGALWERQALCKARVVFGSPRIAKSTMAAVGRAAFEHRWPRANVDEVRKMRRRLEETASPGNLKRGPGGLVDIEFLAQMLQLKHGRRSAKVRVPNTLGALGALLHADHLTKEDYNAFTKAYRFLRTIESRLRLMNHASQSRLPDDPTELTKLSHLMRWPSAGALVVDFERTLRETRERFDRIFDACGTQS